MPEPTPLPNLAAAGGQSTDRLEKAVRELSKIAKKLNDASRQGLRDGKKSDEIRERLRQGWERSSQDLVKTFARTRGRMAGPLASPERMAGMSRGLGEARMALSGLTGAANGLVIGFKALDTMQKMYQKTLRDSISTVAASSQISLRQSAMLTRASIAAPLISEQMSSERFQQVIGRMMETRAVGFTGPGGLGLAAGGGGAAEAVRLMEQDLRAVTGMTTEAMAAFTAEELRRGTMSGEEVFQKFFPPGAMAEPQRALESMFVTITENARRSAVGQQQYITVLNTASDALRPFHVNLRDTEQRLLPFQKSIAQGTLALQNMIEMAGGVAAGRARAPALLSATAILASLPGKMFEGFRRAMEEGRTPYQIAAMSQEMLQAGTTRQMVSAIVDSPLAVTAGGAGEENQRARALFIADRFGDKLSALGLPRTADEILNVIKAGTQRQNKPATKEDQLDAMATNRKEQLSILTGFWRGSLALARLGSFSLLSGIDTASAQERVAAQETTRAVMASVTAAVAPTGPTRSLAKAIQVIGGEEAKDPTKFWGRMALGIEGLQTMISNLTSGYVAAEAAKRLQDSLDAPGKDGHTRSKRGS